MSEVDKMLDIQEIIIQTHTNRFVDSVSKKRNERVREREKLINTKDIFKLGTA